MTSPKLPQKGGAKKAAKAIKKMRKQKPSKKLVKLISEYGSSEGNENVFEGMNEDFVDHSDTDSK